jgi:hypothetical protein
MSVLVPLFSPEGNNLILSHLSTDDFRAPPTFTHFVTFAQVRYAMENCTAIDIDNRVSFLGVGHVLYFLR